MDDHIIQTERYNELKLAIDEIRNTQNKVAAALLGSLEQQNPGLIEESRNLRKEVEELKIKTVKVESEVTTLVEFKQDIRKIVIGIAMIVPFIYEILKGSLYFIWEYLKTPKH